MKDINKLIVKYFELAQALLKVSNDLNEDGEATLVATAFGKAYIMRDSLNIDNKKIEDAVFNFLNYKSGLFVDGFLLENVFTHEVELMGTLSNDRSPTRIVVAQIINIYNLLCALEMCALQDKYAAGQLLHFKEELLEASSNWVFNESVIVKVNNFIKSHGDSMHADYKKIFRNIKAKNSEPCL